MSSSLSSSPVAEPPYIEQLRLQVYDQHDHTWDRLYILFQTRNITALEFIKGIEELRKIWKTYENRQYKKALEQLSDYPKKWFNTNAPDESAYEVSQERQ